ncbi:MAG: signal peptide peptidase SppA, partial [Arenimonas sp.]
MSESRGNPVWSLLVGFGKFINFANHLVFNLIMLFLVFMIVALITLGMSAKSGAGSFRPVQDHTALVLDLEGTLVEQYTSAPIERALAQATGDEGREFQLRDLTKALKVAK